MRKSCEVLREDDERDSRSQEGIDQGYLMIELEFFEAEPFEVTRDEFVNLVATLYRHSRIARKAGDGATSAACFQEGRLLLAAHRSDLTVDQLEELRLRLADADYGGENEGERDPYGLDAAAEEQH
jgi:hypothetical protein